MLLSPAGMRVSLLPEIRYRTDLGWADVVVDARGDAVVTACPLPESLDVFPLALQERDYWWPGAPPRPAFDEQQVATSPTYVSPMFIEHRWGFSVENRATWLIQVVGDYESGRRIGLVIEVDGFLTSRKDLAAYTVPHFEQLHIAGRAEPLSGKMYRSMFQELGPRDGASVQLRFPGYATGVIRNLYTVVDDPDSWLAPFPGESEGPLFTDSTMGIPQARPYAVCRYGGFGFRSAHTLTREDMFYVRSNESVRAAESGFEQHDADDRDWQQLCCDVNPWGWTLERSMVQLYREQGWTHLGLRTLLVNWWEKDGQHARLGFDRDVVHQAFTESVCPERWMNALSDGRRVELAARAGLSLEEVERMVRYGTFPDDASLRLFAQLLP